METEVGVGRLQRVYKWHDIYVAYDCVLFVYSLSNSDSDKLTWCQDVFLKGEVYELGNG
jgi:hypothetical protein